jgi:formamidopyrimidine-DNA glycosylase
MPELPDLELYASALRARIIEQPLDRLRLLSPFFLRSIDVAPSTLEGRRTLDVQRISKRLVLAFDGDLFAVIHLMIAGRLHWREAGTKVGGRKALAVFAFPRGELLVTEAGSHKRASLHIVRGRAAVEALDPGGLDVMSASLDAFAAALRRENHTVKRALTDPHLFSGIGNAYSDEILHHACMSPTMLTGALTDDALAGLFDACRAVLSLWRDRLRAEAGDRFPEKVTAFRPGMAVHGRYGQPCPRCGAPVQRVVHPENESNYCAVCQTGGRLLADRALSRLLREDRPKTLAELGRRFPGAPPMRSTSTRRRKRS